MVLNCGVGEDSWESLGQQGDQTSQSWRKSVLNIHWKDWCWSCSSNTLATWCEELTQWKRPWCWERLKVGGEGDDRGWDGWTASPTQWTWVWASSGSWWWTRKPGVLQSMGLQRVGNDWVTELNWGFGRQIWRKIVWNIKLMCKINELRGHWQSPLEIKRSSIITHQGDGVGTGLLRDLLSLPAFISEEIYFPGHVLLDLWISLCLPQ